MSGQTRYATFQHPTPPTQIAHNLVSDSTLISDAIEFLRAQGGRARITDIADAIFYTQGLDTLTATSFFAELIAEDARLRFAEDENKRAFVELAKVTPETYALREMDFVVVDVETTGARVPPCRVTEIGAYRVRQNKIVGEFHTLVNPQTPIPPFITDLTGISNAMVENAPIFNDVIFDWLNFIGTSILVAHNAVFDMRFLNSEIARIFPNRRMANSHVCTVKLSRRLLPTLQNHRLHTLADHFSISIVNRHRAADDAHATAKIFIHMLDMLERNGINHLNDFVRE